MSNAPVLVSGNEQQFSRPEISDEQKALQVLTMAQRTAEDHLETARREAEHIRTEARAAAGQIVAEAQQQAEATRAEAHETLNRARASAAKIAREAEAYADKTEQAASDLLTDAQGRADEIVREAQANAYDIKQRADRTYEDVVGGLTSKRQALQQQIESLEQFDHEYRARLTAFMQQQMRALWVNQPQVAPDAEDTGTVAGELLPANAEPGEHVHEEEPETR